MSKRIFTDPNTSAWLGGGFLLLGAMLLNDAFEGRGRPRPFWLRFLPAS